jgi:hypothetical protein
LRPEARRVAILLICVVVEKDIPILLCKRVFVSRYGWIIGVYGEAWKVILGGLFVKWRLCGGYYTGNIGKSLGLFEERL